MRPTRQKAYYAQQAEECATAAAATTIAEIKEAYLNLEQGWRHLFPEAAEERGAPNVDAQPATDKQK